MTPSLPALPVVLTLSQSLALLRLANRFQDADALKALANDPVQIFVLLSDPALAADVEQILIALFGTQAPHLPIHQLIARIEAELPGRLESLSGYLDTEITPRLEQLAVGLRAMVTA